MTLKSDKCHFSSAIKYESDLKNLIGISAEWKIYLIGKSMNCRGLNKYKRCHLTSIENPIVEIRQSYDRLTSTMGFPILIICNLSIESGPITLVPHLSSHCVNLDPCSSPARRQGDRPSTLTLMTLPLTRSWEWHLSCRGPTSNTWVVSGYHASYKRCLPFSRDRT